MGQQSMAHRNVTLSLPEEVLRAARHRAVDKGMSLSAYLAWVLKQQVLPDEDYERAMKSALKRMEKGLPIGTHGKIWWTRDELHER